MVQWGDGLQALHLQIARNNLYDASKHVRHRETNKASKLSDTKNWRPQIIGFVETCRSSDGEFTVKHPSTLDFLSQLRKGGGLTVVSSIVLGDLHKLTEEDSIKKVSGKFNYKKITLYLGGRRYCRVVRETSFGMLYVVDDIT